MHIRAFTLPLLLLSFVLPSIAQARLYLQPLDYDVTDAEYSKALNAVVMVSAYPANALYILNAIEGTERSVALPLEPIAVSVSIGGRKAVVAHDGWVTHVDLKNAAVIDTFPVAAESGDIVLAAHNRHAYIFPARDQWTSIHYLNLATGETGEGSGLIYAGVKARLHPARKAIYGADNGLSPSDIEKYDISADVPVILYDSPYHGDYPMCGDLWFTEDGGRIITRCGRIFRATSNQSTDMTYAGSLSGVTEGFIRSATHSKRSKRLVLLREDNWLTQGLSEELQVYEGDFFTHKNTQRLPDFPDGDPQDPATQFHPVEGRHVFLARGGWKFFAVVESADVGRFALVTNFAAEPLTRLRILPASGEMLDTQQFDIALALGNSEEVIASIVSANIDGTDVTQYLADRCTQFETLARGTAWRCPGTGQHLASLATEGALRVTVETASGKQLSATTEYRFTEVVE